MPLGGGGRGGAGRGGAGRGRGGKREGAVGARRCRSGVVGGAGRGGAEPGGEGGRGGGSAPVLLGGNGWGWQGGRPESTTMLSRRRRRLPEATARPVRCHEFDWVDTDL